MSPILSMKHSDTCRTWLPSSSSIHINFKFSTHQATKETKIPLICLNIPHVVQLDIHELLSYNTHLATLLLAFDTNASNVDDVPLKILSFLSLQTDQRRANGMILRSSTTHPLKGPDLHDFASSDIVRRRHHSILHFLAKWNQIPEASQWGTDDWPTHAPSCTSWISLNCYLTSSSFLLKLTAVDTYPITASRQNASALGGAYPNHKRALEYLGYPGPLEQHRRKPP